MRVVSGVFFAVLVVSQFLTTPAWAHSEEYEGYLCKLAREELELQYRFLTDESCTEIARDAVEGLDWEESVYRGAAVENDCQACRRDRKGCHKDLRKIRATKKERCAGRD